MVQEMKEKVKLKSYPNGIRIVIEQEAPLGDVLIEIGDKFQAARKFFGSAGLAVTFEGRKNTPQEENAIIDTIQENSDLKIVCIASMEKEDAFDRAINGMYKAMESDSAQFYRGNLTNKQIFETEQNIIILGNVESGSCIVSRKNIIVLGCLSGSAYAGVDGKSHYIAALSMQPETIRIGEHKGKYKSRSLWGRKKKETPQIAYLKEDTIVFEDLLFTEELLQQLD